MCLSPHLYPLKCYPFFNTQLIYHCLHEVFLHLKFSFANQCWPFPPVHPQHLVCTSLMEFISLCLVLVTSVLITFFISPGRYCVVLNSLCISKTKVLLCTWQVLMDGVLISFSLLSFGAHSIVVSISGQEWCKKHGCVRGAPWCLPLKSQQVEQLSCNKGFLMQHTDTSERPTHWNIRRWVTGWAGEEAREKCRDGDCGTQPGVPWPQQFCRRDQHIIWLTQRPNTEGQ